MSTSTLASNSKTEVRDKYSEYKKWERRTIYALIAFFVSFFIMLFHLLLYPTAALAIHSFYVVFIIFYLIIEKYEKISKELEELKDKYKKEYEELMKEKDYVNLKELEDRRKRRRLILYWHYFIRDKGDDNDG